MPGDRSRRATSAFAWPRKELPIWRQTSVGRHAVRAAPERLFRCASVPNTHPRDLMRSHSQRMHMALGEQHESYAQGSDNGPLSLLRLPRGCVAVVFTVLKSCSNSQRLL